MLNQIEMFPKPCKPGRAVVVHVITLKDFLKILGW